MTDMDKKDGGAAFPRPMFAANRESETCFDNGATGMSLRDWFAGQAMAGMLGVGPVEREPTVTEWAELAYEMADALLTEKAKREGRG